MGKIRASLKDSSSGTDHFNSIIVAKATSYIGQTLVQVVNISFRKGTFPELLKRAVVMPIYRSRDRASMSNYRPVLVS